MTSRIAILRNETLARRAILAVASLLFALMLAPTGVLAQSGEPDDAELERFVHAYVEVMEIRTEMEAEMTEAGSAEAAQGIQQQANDEIMSTLDEHDFSPERYAEITNLLNANEELLAEFHELFNELTGDTR